MSKQQKNPALAVADDLAAKSRIVRKAATVATQPYSPDPDEVLSRLHTIGFEHSNEMSEREEAKRAAAVASIQPLIQKARVQLAASDAAREEAKGFVKKFENVKWDVLRSRFNDYEGSTAEDPSTTRDKVAQLRAAVEALRDLAATGDGEFHRFLSSASALTETESHNARYTVRGLYDCVSMNDGTAQSLRNRIVAIRRLLEVLGAALISQAVSNDVAPQTQSEVK